MLALLLNPPKTEQEWARWSFHHRASHEVIRHAIYQQFAVSLPEYILDPIALQAPRGFLEANQQAHVDMNGIVGRPASNLEEVDLANAGQLQSWIYLHWQEHNVMENSLGVGS